MNTLLLVLVLGFQVLVIIGGVIVGSLIVWQQYQMLVKGMPPFVPIPKEVLQQIVSALELKPNAVFYDLGCGDGRVMEAVLKSRPDVRAIGIDFDPWAVHLAKKHLRTFIENKRAEVIQEDLFETSFKEATVVYTYLFPEFMNRLFPKLQSELKPGTRLVSCDFVFADKQPIKTIDLHRTKGKLGKMIYVYEF